MNKRDAIFRVVGELVELTGYRIGDENGYCPNYYASDIEACLELCMLGEHKVFPALAKGVLGLIDSIRLDHWRYEDDAESLRAAKALKAKAARLCERFAVLREE